MVRFLFLSSLWILVDGTYFFFYIETKNTLLKYDNLEKEYQKAQRALEKSRKAKDVEMLFAENDALQNKLISQEEQFREQNQALLQELANVRFILHYLCPK